VNLDVKDYGDIDFGFPKRECKAESYTPTGGTDGKPVQLKNIKEVAGANRKVIKHGFPFLQNIFFALPGEIMPPLAKQ